MALYNAPLKQLAAGQSTLDYKHAAKLFLSDNYRLAPKQSFLYYVCLNINQTVLSNLLGMGISSQPISDQYETGMMVKSVDLPKFSVDTKTLNAYNRKNVVQNKIQYDPISITFHDDCANVVLNFWNDYYTYYYRDSDYEPGLYKVPHKYDLRQRQGWGYGIRNSNIEPFLSDIQIFSLNQKRFTEYRLINPTITTWRHGEHRASEGTGTMEHSMTVAYETVKYRTGYVNAVDVNGFALLHYDNESSPISESTTNIYTAQGLLGAIGGGSTDLSRPDGAFSGTGLLNNYLAMQRAFESLKSVDWTTVASQTISQIGASIINGAINGAYNAIFVPTASSANGITAVPGTYGYSGNPYVYPAPTNAVWSNGNVVGSVTGAYAGSYTGYMNNSYATSYIAQPNNGGVVIGSNGVPIAGTNVAYFLDPETGQPVTSSGFEVKTAGNGGYVAGNPEVNLATIMEATDQEGNSVYIRTYANGDQTITSTAGEGSVEVRRAQNTGQTYTSGAYPGSYLQYGNTGGIINTINTLPYTVANNIVGGVTYGIINPITNTITGALNTATNAFINNVISPVNGLITQGIDTMTGSVQNVINTSFGEVSSAVSNIYNANQDWSYNTYYAIDSFGDSVPVSTDSWMSSYSSPDSDSPGFQYYD